MVMTKHCHHISPLNTVNLQVVEVNVKTFNLFYYITNYAAPAFSRSKARSK